MGSGYFTGVNEMPNDFDNPPLYDELTKYNKDKMSDVWVGWISTFMGTIVTYLSQNGIFLPNLTTDQRDDLQNPQNGQMIYNTDLNTAQYFNNGIWSPF